MKTETVTYVADSGRYAIGGVELHAGYPVTVIERDGSKFDTRIESDAAGWYLVDYPQNGMKLHDLEGLKVAPF